MRHLICPGRTQQGECFPEGWIGLVHAQRVLDTHPPHCAQASDGEGHGHAVIVVGLDLDSGTDRRIGWVDGEKRIILDLHSSAESGEFALECEQAVTLLVVQGVKPAEHSLAASKEGHGGEGHCDVGHTGEVDVDAVKVIVADDGDEVGAEGKACAHLHEGISAGDVTLKRAFPQAFDRANASGDQGGGGKEVGGAGGIGLDGVCTGAVWARRDMDVIKGGSVDGGAELVHQAEGHGHIGGRGQGLARGIDKAESAGQTGSNQEKGGDELAGEGRSDVESVGLLVEKRMDAEGQACRHIEFFDASAKGAKEGDEFAHGAAAHLLGAVDQDGLGSEQGGGGEEACGGAGGRDVNPATARQATWAAGDADDLRFGVHRDAEGVQRAAHGASVIGIEGMRERRGTQGERAEEEGAIRQALGAGGSKADAEGSGERSEGIGIGKGRHERRAADGVNEAAGIVYREVVVSEKGDEAMFDNPRLMMVIGAVVEGMGFLMLVFGVLGLTVETWKAKFVGGLASMPVVLTVAGAVLALVGMGLVLRGVMGMNKK